MCVQMMLVWLYILLEQSVMNLYLKWNYDTNLLDLEGLLDLYINILLKIARGKLVFVINRFSRNCYILVVPENSNLITYFRYTLVFGFAPQK